MRIYSKVLGIAILLIVTSCTTTNNASKSSSDNEDSIITAKDLPIEIHKIPKLSVQGTEVFYTNSKELVETRPLFVLDGMKMGRNLGRIMQVLDPKQRVSVQFLRSTSALVRYENDEGKNGALVINTID